MQIEHITGERFTTGRLAGQQRDLPMGRRVFGQVIDHHKRMQAEVEVQKLHQNAEREKVQAQITVTQASAQADAVRAQAQAEAEAILLRGEAEAKAIRAISACPWRGR